MKCNLCGMVIEKNWEYCPNCSKKTKDNSKKIIIFSIILIVLLGFGLFDIIKKNKTINEKYIMRNLSNKYNEEFNDIQFVKSLNNPDIRLGCDGSSFGTIEGKGSKEYYKVHSINNNIDFFAYYDTSDISKYIYDTYQIYLNRRDNILKIYDLTKTYISDNNINFSISYNNEQPIEIISKDHLKIILSNFKENDIYNFTSDTQTFNDKVYITLKEDIFEYSKNNYSNLKKINDEVVNLNNKYFFSMSILFNNGATIELDRLYHEPYVYDEFENNKAWGEKLDDFVMRDQY